MRTATGKEDPELSLLQRINSLELQASEIAAQINASQIQVTDTLCTLLASRVLHTFLVTT
jgi:hypothetical protein